MTVFFSPFLVIDLNQKGLMILRETQSQVHTTSPATRHKRKLQSHANR